MTIEIFLFNFFGGGGGSKCMTKWQFLLIFLKRVQNKSIVNMYTFGCARFRICIKAENIAMTFYNTHKIGKQQTENTKFKKRIQIPRAKC